MKRAVSIDGITFDYPLFVSDMYEADDYEGSANETTSGQLITKEILKGDLSKNVMLYSGENGWIKNDTKKKLFNDVDTKIKIIEFNDGSNETYYYDLSNPIKAEPLYDGSDWYKIEINLLKGI